MFRIYQNSLLWTSLKYSLKQIKIKKGKNMQKDLIEQNWDYTKHAEFYSYRPNYAKQAIDILAFYACQNGGGGMEI